MKTSRKWIWVALAGLGFGVGGRLWNDAWHRSPRQQNGGAATRVHENAAALSPSRLPGNHVTATEAAAASHPPELVESILAAEGFEQAERLGRFLTSATPEELKRLLRGLRSQQRQMEMTLGESPPRDRGSA